MSHCGHDVTKECHCADPPYLLCEACFMVHTFQNSNHTCITSKPIRPAQQAPEPVHPVLREVEQEVDLRFAAFQAGIKQLKIKAMRDVTVAVKSALTEITTLQPFSNLARAIKSNTWREFLGLNRICEPLLQDLEAQIEALSNKVQTTDQDLHWLQPHCVQTWNFQQQVFRQPVPLSQLLDRLHLYLNSGPNEVLVFNVKPSPCYRVNTRTGEIISLNEMRESRHFLGPCVTSDGQILAIGGRNAEGSALTSAEYFRSTDGRWVLKEARRKLLVGRSHFQPVEHAGYLYLIGGSHPSCDRVKIATWEHERLRENYLSDLTGSFVTLVTGYANEIVIIRGNVMITDNFSFNSQLIRPLEEQPLNSQTRPVLQGRQVWVLLSDGNCVALRLPN